MVLEEFFWELGWASEDNCWVGSGFLVRGLVTVCSVSLVRCTGIGFCIPGGISGSFCAISINSEGLGNAGLGGEEMVFVESF